MVSAAVKSLERDLREIVRSYFQPLRLIQKDVVGAKRDSRMVSAAVKSLERDLREIVRSYFQPLRLIQKDVVAALPVFCGQCGEAIFGEPPSGDPTQRRPCPKCGSTARAFSVTAHFTAFAQVTGQAEAVTYVQYFLLLARTPLGKGSGLYAALAAMTIVLLWLYQAPLLPTVSGVGFVPGCRLCG
jgi:hypothetical protein